MDIDRDHFVHGVVVRHGSWTLLLDRLGAWLVRDGTVIAGVRWWR